ncbi:hypothetical protein [Thiohalocapsa sp. ML1]|jgi:molecular chaperone GrpE (heat shock protein)|uniref:hypothetical protein n=1 Tax=Thiohalocapsa sp. ML1 TaxID=1431688 RepID=UPI000731F306|nr:hypothetical protein [Thiohalocapsa sp. ML1]
MDPEAGASSPDDRLRHIAQAIEALARGFEDKLKYDSFKEQQIERLHAELQEHKRDLIGAALRPIFTRLIRISSDALKLADELPDRRPAPTPEQVSATLRSLAEDIELLLLDSGVSRLDAAAPGVPFDPMRQFAAVVEHCDDPAADGRIAARLRAGFEYGRILLRKEHVSVYRLREQPDAFQSSVSDTQASAPPTPAVHAQDSTASQQPPGSRDGPAPEASAADYEEPDRPAPESGTVTPAER